MTLTPHDPETLDRLALRLLDLAAIVREMANNSREFGVQDFALHDKKAREWYSHLERWTRKAQAELELKIIEVRASRRAFSAGDNR